MTTKNTLSPAAQSLPAMPDELLDVTAQDEGLGTSSRPEDLLLPIITVVQSNTPIADKRSPEYLADAEPGCFWARNDIDPIRDGVVGLEAIPVVMVEVFNEWGPSRGGGLFGRHLKLPDDAGTRNGPEDSTRLQWVRRGSGNVLQHAREFYLLIDGKPYVLPFHGTGHTTARKWQMHFKQLRHPKTGGVLPAFARKYRLTTVAQSNALGKWFGVHFTDIGWTSKPEYDAAKELLAIITRGAYRVEMSAIGTEAA